jgi:ATP-dependent Zn protease
MSADDLPPPPGSGEPSKPAREGWPRWSLWILIAAAVSLLFLPMLLDRESGDEISYGEFKEQLAEGNVDEATFDNNNGAISGKLDNGTEFRTTGPLEPSDADLELMTAQGVEFKTPESSAWATWLPFLAMIGFVFSVRSRAWCTAQ